MSINNSNFLSLSTFLQQHKYQIPEYQRGYSWTESQLEDLWIDLTQLVADDDLSSHFLGQIVVHYDKDSNKYFIIDGQQRASTSIILLDTFRSMLDNLREKYGFEDARIEADDITTKYIGRVTAKRSDERLILGYADKIFFKNLIQNRESKITTSTNLLSRSENLIYKAKLYYDNKLNEFFQNISDPKEKLTKIIEMLEVVTDNLKLMYIETDDINEAFVIFETLNARGKELETSDLLKNHVFRTSNDRIDIIKSEWERMIENLGNIDPTRFIRHYWNSQNTFIREKDLYKNIRKKIDNSDEVDSLISDLLNLSELYISLNSPITNIYFQNNALIERTQEAKNLGATSYFPIILSLVKKRYAEEDIDQIFESLECLIVRNFIVAGKVANKYELEFANIAFEISQCRLVETLDIIARIKGLTIADEEFKANFKIFTTKKTPVIRYLLRKIHNNNNPETRIINDNNVVHVEHIMPKKIGEWNINEENHIDYLWRLGNLTLLGNEYNRSATNSIFVRKKEVYKDSDIPMTKDLAEYKTWLMEDIRNRQEQFSEIAVNIWNK